MRVPIGSHSCSHHRAVCVSNLGILLFASSAVQSFTVVLFFFFFFFSFFLFFLRGYIKFDTNSAVLVSRRASDGTASRAVAQRAPSPQVHEDISLATELISQQRSTRIKKGEWLRPQPAGRRADRKGCGIDHDKERAVGEKLMVFMRPSRRGRNRASRGGIAMEEAGSIPSPTSRSSTRNRRSRRGSAPSSWRTARGCASPRGRGAQIPVRLALADEEEQVQRSPRNRRHAKGERSAPAAQAEGETQARRRQEGEGPPTIQAAQGKAGTAKGAPRRASRNLQGHVVPS